MIYIYILITPARNEEKFLPKVIKSVINQKVQPKLWLIMDDGSTDNTPQIIKKYKNEIDWIHSIRIVRKTFEYKGVLSSSARVKKAIKHAQKLAKRKDIYYEYIGLLDADIKLKDNYFKVLLNEAIKQPKCGIISGLLHENNKRDKNTGYPRGGARLHDKNLFNDIGGYPVTASTDTVIFIKAKNRDWKLIKTGKTYGLQLRPPASSMGKWKGLIRRGEMRYYLRYHPINALLLSLKLSLEYPFYHGLAFFYGYFRSKLLKNKQTDDQEIINYFYYREYDHLKKKLNKIISSD